MGAVVASLLGGWRRDKFGRKPTLLLDSDHSLFCRRGGSGLATDTVTMFHYLIAVIGGLGIGISTVVGGRCTSPRLLRRSIVAGWLGVFQINIDTLIAFRFERVAVAGLAEKRVASGCLGVAAFPSLLYAAFCLRTAESADGAEQKRRSRGRDCKYYGGLNQKPHRGTCQAEARHNGFHALHTDTG